MTSDMDLDLTSSSILGITLEFDAGSLVIEMHGHAWTVSRRLIC